MRLLRYILTIIIFGLIGIFGLYIFGRIWIKNSWKSEFNTTEIIKFCDKINSANDLPDNFKVLFDSTHVNARTNDMVKKYNGIILVQIFGLKPRKYTGQKYYSERLFEIYNPSFNWNNLFDRKLLFAFGVESMSTPSKCVDYYLLNRQFEINDTIDSKGIINLSIDYFKKPIDKLDRREIIKLITLTDFDNFESITDKDILFRETMYLKYLKIKYNKD